MLKKKDHSGTKFDLNTHLGRLVLTTRLCWIGIQQPSRKSGWSEKTEKLSQWTSGETYFSLSAASTWKKKNHGTINGWYWKSEWSSVAYNSTIKDCSSVSWKILKEKAKISFFFLRVSEGLETLQILCNFLQVFSSLQNVWSCLRERLRRRAGD